MRVPAVTSLLLAVLLTLPAGAGMAQQEPPPLPTAKLYHVDEGGIPGGPYPAAELRGMIEAGAVMPETLVWTQGMEQWAPAGEVDALAAMFADGSTAPGGRPLLKVDSINSMTDPDQVFITLINVSARLIEDVRLIALRETGETIVDEGPFFVDAEGWRNVGVQTHVDDDARLLTCISYRGDRGEVVHYTSVWLPQEALVPTIPQGESGLIDYRQRSPAELVPGASPDPCAERLAEGPAAFLDGG